MNYNYLPKKKRGIYEKEFTLQHVLQNLQGYRLASGAIDPNSIQERINKGEDLGEIYGQIISSRHTPAGPSSADGNSHTRKRKRKRKRTSKKSSSSLNVVQPETEAPHSVSGSTKEKLPQSPLLVPYRDSSASSDTSEEVSIDMPAYCRSTGPLPIPSAIHDMYKTSDEAKDTPSNSKQEDKMPKRSATWDSDSNDELGYFECVDSSSDDSDNERDEKTDEGTAGANLDQPEKPLIPEVSKNWSEKRAQWLFGPSQLSTYTCWKCNNVGHLPQDCTVAGTHTPSASGSGGSETASMKSKVPKTVQQLLATCREIYKKKGQRCADCGVHSNLVACLDCGSIFCDGRGHIIGHLLQHSSHHKLFSFKLRRLLKCCKKTCEVVNIYDLLVCSHCLSKAFSQHYSMITAAWSRAGLVKICNAIGCEEHFQWHRMNCEAVGDEMFVEESTLHSRLQTDGKLSEFFF